MGWTNPTTRVVGEKITAPIWNTDVADNLNFLGSSEVLGWQAFSFINSWIEGGVGPGTSGLLDGVPIAPSPAFRLEGGDTVRLAGQITGGSWGTPFAVLPAGYRPVYVVATPIIDGSGTAAFLNIDAGGTCNVGGGTGVAVLDGVTFPTN